MSEYKTIEELKGRILKLVEHNLEEAVFTCYDGTRFRMYHSHDCCEQVQLERVIGNLDDILNSPITYAQEFIGHEGPETERHESCTLTDFKISTEKGAVTFHWIGSSNGYYSESVYFVQL